jgi:AcrR family transcriptional regulator
MAAPTLPTLTPKGEATRERILAAASALMYDQGMAVTSIDEVKAVAGVSSSQLYHYFADKRTLVTAVIERQSELVLGFQEPALLAVDDLESLRGWRDAVIATVQARGGVGGCPIGSLASELSDRDASHREALAAGFERWETAIREGLERMRERGELAQDADPAELALALLAALQGGLLLAQVRRSVAPLRAALDGMLERIAGLAR